MNLEISKTFLRLCASAVMLPSLLFALTSSTDVEIDRVVPSKVCVGVNGQQNSATLRGKNLEKIRAIRVFLNKKPVPEILGQLERGKESSLSRNIFFVAAPNATLSEGYKVYGITKDKQIFPIPIELEIVAADDERGKPVPIEEMTKGKGEFAGSVVSVDITQAPVVTKTIPEPFVIKADGQFQSIVLKGRNLDKITEIRLRRADRKKYIGNSGIIPFTKDGNDIKLDLSMTSNSSDKYCLDLIMGRFIAGTLTFETASRTTSAEEPSPEKKPGDLAYIKPEE